MKKGLRKHINIDSRPLQGFDTSPHMIQLALSIKILMALAYGLQTISIWRLGLDHVGARGEALCMGILMAALHLGCIFPCALNSELKQCVIYYNNFEKLSRKPYTFDVGKFIHIFKH